MCICNFMGTQRQYPLNVVRVLSIIHEPFFHANDTDQLLCLGIFFSAVATWFIEEREDRPVTSKQRGHEIRFSAIEHIGRATIISLYRTRIKASLPIVMRYSCTVREAKVMR